MCSATFLTLPSELVEAILISSQSPRTVSCVAQTCRTLRTLVYATTDSHLWRELFLTLWDDPRPALRHRALLDPRVDPTNWDWGAEYRTRVAADKQLKAWRSAICAPDGASTSHSEGPDWTSPDGTDPSRYNATLSALSAVLSTLLTMLPFPMTPPISVTPVLSSSGVPIGNAGSGLGERREHMKSAPPLPPLLIVLASGLTAFPASRSGARIGRMVYGPYATRTRDGQDEPMLLVPTPSLPPQLSRMLLASRVIGVRGMPAHKPGLTGAEWWGENKLGDVFHRIVCITGFVAIPTPLNAVDGALPPTAATGGGGEGGEDTDLPGRFPTPAQQHSDARTLARRRVYDMRYLRGDRMWGPFHIVTREDLCADRATCAGGRKGDGEDERGGMHRLGTLAWAMGMNVELDQLESSDEGDDDEDWHDDSAGQDSGPSSYREHEETATMDDESGDSSTEPEHPIISLILDPITSASDDAPSTSSRGTRRSKRRMRPPKAVSSHHIRPQHLRPDYVFLASVRIVVESNLRELFGRDIVDDVGQAASGVSAGNGGVGMFWEDEDEVRARGSAAPLFNVSSSSNSETVLDDAAPNDTRRNFELADLLSQFQNLEVARLGSACGYWGGWSDRPVSAAESMDGGTGPSSNGDVGARKPRIVMQPDELEKPIKKSSTQSTRKGKEKGQGSSPGLDAGLLDWEMGPEGESCEGWDWAGVSGIWKRCVCWMDYRELLFFNLDSSKFLTLDTQEACRIIPMEFRITGYTRAALMPIYDAEPKHAGADTKRRSKTRYFRPPPVIHFSGSSIGSDRGQEDGRSVTGTVQLIGGGEARWQLDTYTQESHQPGTNAPEWSSEGVQVGGIASTVGVLGMWTGAEHERADPLGPFWAWKVA